ncbi:MAG: ATP-binding protein [bacterium]|nr:ATP-binding protein [Candidatus Colisoma equi]
MLLTGLRGVGKTVVLNEVMRMAEDQGVLPVYIEATAETSLSEMLAPELKKLFFTLNRMAGAKEKQRAVLLLVDEVQYLPMKELSALIMAFHRLQESGIFSLRCPTVRGQFVLAMLRRCLARVSRRSASAGRRCWRRA